MDSFDFLQRKQLELVLQKRKLNEVYSWFSDHFINAPQADYISRCPFVIIQGPTGCGKTSTLKWISHELNIPIKEYNEALDTTAINYDLSRRGFGTDATNNDNLSQLIERRKARKFEDFVIDSIMYNTNYLGPSKTTIDDAPRDDDEFDSDDDLPVISTAPKVANLLPASGLIIHVESSLNFARSQRILIQTICKLMKIFKEMSKRHRRRVAIVFETLECDGETFSIPNKMKISLGIQVFKFNAITQKNMKKLVESMQKGFVLDQDTIERIANDSDGDIRACVNLLKLARNSGGNGNLNQLSPAIKKQKLNHAKVKKFELHSSLMRDITKSLGFFHVLGKIFYQKRLYPIGQTKPHRTIERPYPTENSTEYLVDMLDIEAKKLKAWLHQHYYKFCHDSSIEKAALFLDDLSTIDTISIESTQSSQFYETLKSLDPIQVYTIIESTVFCLYDDQSKTTIKPSHKKVQTDEGSRIVKTSIENVSNNGELYSFNKPASIGLPNLIDDYKVLLEKCTCNLVNSSSARLDSTKVLVDYIPYLTLMSDNQRRTTSPGCNSSDRKSSIDIMLSLPELSLSGKPRDEVDHKRPWTSETMMKIIGTINTFETDLKLDFDTRHEKLLEIIEELGDQK